MQTTTNYGFKKPEDNEAFDQQAHANYNMDQIDTQIKARADDLAAHLADNTKHIDGNPAARVYRSTNQTIPDDVNTALVFDSARFDNDNMFNPAEGNKLICNTPGKYLLTVNVSFANNSTGMRQVFFRINGTIVIANSKVPASGTTTLDLSTVYELQENDYVEVMVYQNSGDDLDVLSLSNFSPEFAIIKIG